MGPSPRPTLRPTPQSDASIYLDGPWSHRAVSANGTRFHIAENGDGPLVLLLHGFPQFWWTWRKQLSTLASAGYRAVAVDLRGYGGSDKPPHGGLLPQPHQDARPRRRAAPAPAPRRRAVRPARPGPRRRLRVRLPIADAARAATAAPSRRARGRTAHRLVGARLAGPGDRGHLPGRHVPAGRRPLGAC